MATGLVHQPSTIGVLRFDMMAMIDGYRYHRFMSPLEN